MMPLRPRLRSDSVEDIEDYIAAVIEATEQRILARMREDKTELSTLLLSGFPDGDTVMHREYHREQIEYIRARRKLIQAALEKVVSGGVWATLVAIGTLGYYWLKTGGAIK